MKKVTLIEFENLNFRMRKFSVPKVLRELATLAVGEGLVFTKKDWRGYKTDPSSYIHGYARTKLQNVKFKTRRLAGDAGYAVLRIA